MKSVLRSFIAIMISATLLWGATQTVNTIPLNDSQFLSTLQAFLRIENASRFHKKYSGFIFEGGLGATSAGLSHTISAVTGFPGGYYAYKAATSHTYTNTTRTFVFLDYDDSRTLTIPGATITRSTYLVFAEMTAGSSEPQAPASTISLMQVDTSGGAISAVSDLRPGGEIALDCYTSLADAISKIPPKSSILLNSRSVVDADATIVSLAVEMGGQLIPASGKTITINSLTRAPSSQWISGSGIVLFAAGAFKTIPDPTWYGGGSGGVTAANSTNVIETLSASATPSIATGMPVYQANFATLTGFINAIKGHSFTVIFTGVTTVDFSSTYLKGHSSTDWTTAAGDSMTVTVGGDGVTFYCFTSDSAAAVIGDGTGAVQYRNRLVNGSFSIDQRNAGASTAISNDTYCFDRWYALTQTAAINVSQQTLQEAGTPTNIRLTQSQAASQRMGIAQIVEAYNSQWDRSSPVVLSGRIRCSSAQAIRYAILGWTGTANSVTSNFVNDWTSATYTAGNFFLAANLTVVAVGSITPTANVWTDLTALTGTLPSGLNNSAVMIWSEGTCAQNVTLDIGRMQLEPGATATKFERRPYDVNLRMCQRHCYKATGVPVGVSIDTTYVSGAFKFPTTMFAGPTLVAGSSFAVTGGNVGTVAASSPTPDAVVLYNSATNWTPGTIITFTGIFTAEL